jgi:hypothetical protein
MVAVPLDARADITWTLHGVEFTYIDGNYVGDINSETGTFVTDSIGYVESWDISVTDGGPGFPAVTFTPLNSTVSNFGGAFIVGNATAGSLSTSFHYYFALGVSPDPLLPPYGSDGVYFRTPGGGEWGWGGYATIVQPSIPEPSSLALLTVALGMFEIGRLRTCKR